MPQLKSFQAQNIFSLQCRLCYVTKQMHVNMQLLLSFGFFSRSRSPQQMISDLHFVLTVGCPSCHQNLQSVIRSLSEHFKPQFVYSILQNYVSAELRSPCHFDLGLVTKGFSNFWCLKLPSPVLKMQPLTANHSKTATQNK